MPVRTTLTLLVIAVLLTVYALVFERDVSGYFEPPGRIFTALEPSDILKMEIIYGGEDAESRTGAGSRSIRLERRGEYKWWIAEPFEFPAFLPRVQGLTWSIVDLVQVTKIPPEAEAYEKAIPAGEAEVTVRFWTRQGRERTIEVGREYPGETADYIYIRVDGEDVHVTRRDFRQAFSVGLDELRSRTLFPIAAVDARYLSVDVSGAESDRLDKTIRREGEDDAWYFEGRPDLDGTLADRREVEELFRELNAWTVHSFADDGAEDLSRYGLEEPALRVVARHRDGSETRLEIGDGFEEGEESFVWVRRSGERFVFAAEAEPVRYLRLEPEALRTDHVFDFRGEEVDRIECEGPEHRFVLERRGAAGAGEGSEEDEAVVGRRSHWVVRVPGTDTEYPGDDHLIGLAIAETRELLIQKHLDPLPSEDERESFDKRVTVTVRTGEEYTLRLGERSDDPRDRGFEVYRGVRSTDRSRFLVETGWVERIRLGPHAFRDRELSRLNPGNVYEIEIATEGARWTVGRVPGHDWMFSEDERVLPGKTLESSPINDLLLLLSRDRFAVRRFAPGVEPEDYRVHAIGRDTFRYRVTLTVVEGGAPGFTTLIVGHRQVDSDPALYYARVDTYDTPFLLDEAIPEKLDDLVRHLREVTGKR